MRRDCVVPVLLWILLIGSVAAMRLVSLPALGRDLDGHFAESSLMCAEITNTFLQD